jgi:hypothetical protein
LSPLPSSPLPPSSSFIHTGNDHAIPFDTTSAGLYVRYGDIFSAVAPSIWALYSHIISIVNSTDTTVAKVNAFVAPLGTDALDVALLIPVMLGENDNGTVRLNLTSINRVWGIESQGSRGLSIQHPLIKKKKKEMMMMMMKETNTLQHINTKTIGSKDASSKETLSNFDTSLLSGSYSYVFEALWPGQGGQWKQIADPFVNIDSMLVDVGLVNGAALVRGRRVSGSDTVKG